MLNAGPFDCSWLTLTGFVEVWFIPVSIQVNGLGGSRCSADVGFPKLAPFFYHCNRLVLLGNGGYRVLTWLAIGEYCKWSWNGTDRVSVDDQFKSFWKLLKLVKRSTDNAEKEMVIKMPMTIKLIFFITCLLFNVRFIAIVYTIMLKNLIEASSVIQRNILPDLCEIFTRQKLKE
jgi:hypothetical protein